MSYVYITSERAVHGAENDLFTVGFYNPATNRFMPESDHPTKDAAAARVVLLNGGPSTAQALEIAARACDKIAAQLKDGSDLDGAHTARCCAAAIRGILK